MRIDHKDSIKDFGNQFIVDAKLNDYWGSKTMLKDMVKPFNLNQIKNKICMEVGSGSGRILKNLIKFKPKKIFSLEPSKAINVAKANLKKHHKKIQFLNIKGENIKIKNKIDYCFSLAVIHHIPNGQSVCKKIHRSLKKNGTFVCWLYGYEGNELYLFIFNNLRRITILLPDFILRQISILLNIMTYPYQFLCNFFNLPLKEYFQKLFSKCSFQNRNYIIFDQLNPSYAKYYTKKEAYNLFKKAGFKDITVSSRHNYSWVLIGKK